MKAPSSVDYARGEPMPGTKWGARGKLGQGGMGLVLDVEKEGLPRGAMKVLLPHFSKMPEFATTFLTEVKGSRSPRAWSTRPSCRCSTSTGSR